MQINIEQDVSLALIAAICGLAFPIIIQTIGQIDTKYGSTRLIERIKKSWQFYFFIISLISAIIVRIYYCFAPLRSIDFGKWNNFVEHSALWAVYLTLSILIVSLFLFTFLVIKYYSPTSLLNSISKKMIKTGAKKEQALKTNNISGLFPKETKQEKHFKDWTDLVISVIISPNYETASKTVFTAYESLYRYVGIYNTKLAYKHTVYPNYFYNSIRSINKAICSIEPQLSSLHNGNIVVKIFIDDFQKTRISPQSYKCIWMCLSEQLFYNRTELIIEYWTSAHQHYTMFLKRLTAGDVIDRGMKMEHLVTKEDVENRDADRWQFRSLNCALGALLLYQSQYTSLNNIFRYKNSTYESESLIPHSYLEIIDIYLKFNELNLVNPFWIEQQYPFIHIRGVNSTYEIKSWIEKYLAVLVIRVEKLAEINGNKRGINMPSIPHELSDLNYYKEQLSLFREVVISVWQDGIIQNIYPTFTELPIFVNKADQFLSAVNNEYNRIKREQEIDMELLKGFYQAIQQNYKAFKYKIQTISDYKTGNIERPYTCELISEELRFEDKGVFCTNQDIGRGNYNSAVSSMIVHNLESELGHKLFLHSKKTIVGKYDDLFNILDKLNINENYIVITTKVEFEYFINKGIEGICQYEELSGYTYKNIPIINFAHLQGYESCIWILKKSELPIISFEQLPINKKYTKGMANLDEGLFANVVDLYRSPDIIAGLNNESNLEMKILIWVECNMKLHYVDNGKILRVPLLDSFSSEAALDVANIMPFEEYFK